MRFSTGFLDAGLSIQTEDAAGHSGGVPVVLGGRARSAPAGTPAAPGTGRHDPQPARPADCDLRRPRRRAAVRDGSPFRRSLQLLHHRLQPAGARRRRAVRARRRVSFLSYADLGAGRRFLRYGRSVGRGGWVGARAHFGCADATRDARSTRNLPGRAACHVHPSGIRLYRSASIPRSSTWPASWTSAMDRDVCRQ